MTTDKRTKKVQSDALKELLREADFRAESTDDAGGAERVLNALFRNPSALAGQEPPLGYEKQLLASLRAKLPEPAPAAAPVRERARRPLGAILDFFALPQVSWGTAGGLAVFIAVFALTHRSPVSPNANADLLVQTASRGGEAVAQQWLASVGDTGTRVKATRGLSSLAEELGASKNPEAVEKALDEVAESLGMGKL